MGQHVEYDVTTCNLQSQNILDGCSTCNAVPVGLFISGLARCDPATTLRIELRRPMSAPQRQADCGSCLGQSAGMQATPSNMTPFCNWPDSRARTY
eukprot:353313-Chlamydomonas_euryale.AAC.6